MNYQVLQQERELEGIRYISCSIGVFSDGECVRVIEDVFSQPEEAEKFVEICNRLKVSQLHIDNIIEDWINS